MAPGKKISHPAERNDSLVREWDTRRELSDILESISDAFFAMDREWRFTYVNRRAEEFWSRSREDLLGKTLWEEFPQAMGSEQYRRIRHAMEKRTTASFEAISPIVGGWVAGRAYPSANGGVSVYFQDVTERKRVEEDLRESEERYRTLFESIDEGFCVVEVMFEADGEPVDYRFLETNPAFERHTGLHGATGKRMRELAPDHEAHWFEIYGHVASTGESVRFVREAKALEGRWFDVYAFRLGGRESRRVAIVFNDVTERKRAEEALRESEEQHRLIVEGARDYAIFTTDLYGRIESWPPGAAAIFGWTSEEAIGQPSAMLFVPEDRASGEPEKELATAREKGVAPDVRWHVRKDGSRVFIQGMTRYLRDARGLPRGFLKIGQDVTQRREAETALRESEERLQRAVAIETVGVIFFRIDGQITEANDAFLRMSGYSPEDLAEGQLRWDFMTPPEWMRRSLEAVEELQTTGRTTPYEKEYIRKDGSRWWGLFAATSLGEQEGVEFVIDVTGRKRAEEEHERLVAHELTARAQTEERRRLSRELHDRVAHDIALVHQSLELYEVLKESAPEKAAAKIAVAKETVKRAFNATRNLSMELRQREVQRSLEAALSDLLCELVPPNMAFDLSADGDETRVSAEARSQAFLILREAIRNAVTHSECRRITVRSEVLPEEITGYVEDDGRGFDAKTLRPADHNGLRSMEERAALLGGNLDVSSVPGRGTTVRVTIPLGERDGG